MADLKIIEYPISELEYISKWRTDPNINKFIRPGIQTLEEVRQWVSNYFSKDSNQLFSIRYNDKPIGFFMIENIDYVNKKCEFGIVIGSLDIQRRGIGAKSLKIMLKKAFKEMGMHRVYAVIHECNIASVKCFEKAGFIYEGRQREARLINGDFKDVLLYSIVSNEFMKNKL